MAYRYFGLKTLIRRTVFYVAPALGILSLVTVGIYINQANEIEKDFHRDQIAKLRTNTGLIRSSVATALNDVRIIAGLYELRAFASNPSGKREYEKAKSRLENIMNNHWKYRSLGWEPDGNFSAVRLKPFDDKHEASASHDQQETTNWIEPLVTEPISSEENQLYSHNDKEEKDTELIVTEQIVGLNGNQRGHINLGISFRSILNPPNSGMEKIKPRCFMVFGNDNKKLYDSDDLHRSSGHLHPTLSESNKLTKAAFSQIKASSSGTMFDQSGMWTWKRLALNKDITRNLKNEKYILVTHTPLAVINKVKNDFELPLLLGTFSLVGLVILPGGSLIAFQTLRKQEAEKKNKWDAIHDPLTNCLNRNGGAEAINYLVKKSKLNPELVTGFLFIDVDRLNLINNNFSHAAGDEVIRRVSRAIKEIVRASDPIIRMGGDEFVVILEDLSKEEQCMQIAEKIRAQCEDTVIFEDCVISTTVSIGATTSSSLDQENIEKILGIADKAMYLAKKYGRNKVNALQLTAANEGDSDQSEQRIVVGERDKLLPIEDLLEKAIDKKQFSLNYQPICDRSGQMCGAEALLRWSPYPNHFVSPESFIPVAERIGLMPMIGEWVLEQSCMQLQQWNQEFYAIPKLSINLSTTQFKEAKGKERLPDLISNKVSKYNILPQQLDLEITETTLLFNQSIIKTQLADLRGQGFRISIDDFGAGFASLARLRDFPADVLKVDKKFVENIASSEKDFILVLSILEMATNLGMETVVEGVETFEQLQKLRESECNRFQGYYFSKPLSADDFESQFLKKI